MPQFIRGAPDLRSSASVALADALGMGLGNALNTFSANQSLEKALQDKSLESQPLSRRFEALRSALSPYGQKGQELLQQRMMIEQQALQEQESERQQAFERQKGRALGKYLNGGELTPEEQSLFTPKEFVDIYKARNPNQKKTQASQPIDPEQLRLIESVRNRPEYDDLDEVEQYRALTSAGVSKENAAEEAKLTGQKLERGQKAVDFSYKAQEDFINDTTNSYKAFETEIKPRLLQMRNLKDEDLISPTASVFLEKLGIPLGALKDPSSELYHKLSQDLLKGLPETYGSRILKVEVENFLKTIPTLSNSPDGRRMIASNMLKLGEMKEVYYNEMRKQQKEAFDTNKPFPKDFQQRVFDQVKPQVDRLNNEFVKLSEVKSFPKDTIPFFDPRGEVIFVPKEHAQWASENGGKRIW